MPLLFLVATASMYLLSRNDIGSFGTVGYVVAILALAASTVGIDIGQWYLFAFGLLISFVGLVLAGAAGVSATWLPRWNVLPLGIGMVGIVMFVTGDPANSGLGRNASLAIWMSFGLLWMLLGVMMLATGARSAPDRATT